MTQNTQTTAERIETWQRVERMMDSMLVVEHSEPYPHEDGTMGGEYSDYVYDEDHKFRNLIAAEIDALTRERDQARALIPVSRVDLGAHDKTISALAVERDALKAEVERLRPAAEAWEALQAAYHPGRGSSLEYAYSVACFERAGVLRARKAAKEGKP